MNSLRIIFYLLLILDGGVLLFALTRVAWLKGRVYVYPIWLIIFLCLISAMFNVADYMVMNKEASSGVGDVISPAVSFAFISVAIWMLSYSIKFDGLILNISSIARKKRIEISEMAKVTLQTRVRGNWWVDIVEKNGEKIRISGIVNDFRALCSVLEDALSKRGAGIIAMNANGAVRPFSELH